jgi:hypothetical protein
MQTFEIKITINLDNDAFQDDDVPKSIGNCEEEVARILKEQLIDCLDIPTWGVRNHYNFRDVNGNSVGEATILRLLDHVIKT